jgi:polyisoprenoid-binding protein YceI
MRIAFAALLMFGTLSLGCTKATDTATTPAADGAASTDTDAAETETSATADGEETAAGGYKFGPEEAKIVFVGKHVGEPNPRTGHFEKFEGVATLDDEGKTVEAVEVEIAADSLWTPIDNLTNHLNAEDFLDTREFPTATFKSTKIEPGEGEGVVNITGDLTLHGVTKEITFPANVKVVDGKVELTSTLVLKRTEYGMDKNLDKVVEEVDLEIVIGEKTERPAAEPAKG